MKIRTRILIDAGDRKARLTVKLDMDHAATLYVDNVHDPHSAKSDRETYEEAMDLVCVWTSDRHVRGVVDAAALDKLAAEITPLLERVDAGCTFEWDGSDATGELNADASDASDAIQDKVDACDWADNSRQA